MPRLKFLTLPLLVAGLVFGTPTGAKAESGQWNLHLDLSFGVPVVGPLAPPATEDDLSRRIFAGSLALDWQLARPFALELTGGYGTQLETSDTPGAPDDEYWHVGVGGRWRVMDDQGGYADAPAGTYEGNLWVSAHLGYHALDATQFGIDAAVGYELSVFDPISTGAFLRGVMLLGGRRDGPDAALLIGLSISTELSAHAAPDDSDNDGLSDEREARLGTDPMRSDTDGDGINDGVEVETNTDPLKRDTDDDGLLDGQEDSNRDGSLDVEETDPRNQDTDRGGVRDLDEVQDVHMDPRDPSDDDTDRDGVAEPVDECPGTPEGVDVNDRGCGVITERMELSGVLFGTNSAELDARSEDALQRALQILKDNPETRVEIGGHTDNVGNPNYNMALSRRRAQSVRSWLIEHGIPGSRVTARGYGQTQPKGDNETDEGRAQNRRIEIRRLD